LAPAARRGGAHLRRGSLVVCRLDFSPRLGILKQVPNHSPSLDLMYSALADASRRTMVERLSRGPASVKELAAPLAMSLPAVMQHLRVLEASGLVRSAKAGRVRTCRIEPAALQAAEQWIADRRAGWVSRLDRLGEYLADTAPSDPSTLPGSPPGDLSDPSSDPQEDR
jgi:DNA-binding transcriptional ArsR family regulator